MSQVLPYEFCSSPTKAEAMENWSKCWTLLGEDQTGGSQRQLLAQPDHSAALNAVQLCLHSQPGDATAQWLYNVLQAKENHVENGVWEVSFFFCRSRKNCVQG